MKKKKTQKRGCSKSAYISCAAMVFLQFMSTIGVSIYLDQNAQGLGAFNVILTAIAMSVLISFSLVTIAWIVYGLYKAKALFIAFFILIMFTCLLLATFFMGGVEYIIGGLTGMWMEPIHRLIFGVISIVVFSFAMRYIIYYEDAT